MAALLWLTSLTITSVIGAGTRKRWTNCFSDDQTISGFTYVKRHHIDRHLTDAEERCLGIHRVTHQTSTQPIALFVLGVPAVGKSSGMKYVKQNKDLFGIKMLPNSNDLDAVIIDGDLWREANSDTMRLREALKRTDVCCKDYYDLVKDKGKQWKASTLQNALSRRQNIIYPDTICDQTSFLKTFEKFIAAKYLIKVIVIIGDQADVEERGKKRAEYDHRKYKTEQYWYSSSMIKTVVHEIYKYPALVPHLKIVYNRKVLIPPASGNLPLPQEYTLKQFDEKIRSERSWAGKAVNVGVKCVSKFGKVVKEWNSMPGIQRSRRIPRSDFDNSKCSGTAEDIESSQFLTIIVVVISITIILFLAIFAIVWFCWRRRERRRREDGCWFNLFG